MRNLWTKIKKCLQAEMLQKMWKEFLWCTAMVVAVVVIILHNQILRAKQM